MSWFCLSSSGQSRWRVAAITCTHVIFASTQSAIGIFWLIDWGLNLISLLTGAMASSQIDLSTPTPAPDTPFMQAVVAELAFPATQQYSDDERPASGAASGAAPGAAIGAAPDGLFDNDFGAGIAGNEGSVSPGGGPEGSPAETSDNGHSTDISSTSSKDRPNKIQVTSADRMGIGFDELEAHLEKVICLKCKYPIQEEYRARTWSKKGGQLQWICRVCNNIYSMLKKKLDMESLEEAGLQLNFINGANAEAFYKHAHEALGADETLNWQSIKELVIQDLSSRKISRESLVVSQEQLPLSVWATRGFDVEAIKAGGRRFPHPDFGEVWSTPLKTLNTETVTTA